MTQHTLRFTKDGKAYEIEVEVEYPAGRNAGVKVEFVSVVRLADELDIDPTIFFNSLTEEDMAVVDKIADELAYAYQNTDWT